jgi:hypothetical protein
MAQRRGWPIRLTTCTELEPQANAKTVAPTATETTTPKGKRPDAGRKTTARILGALYGARDKAPQIPNAEPKTTNSP